MNWSEPNPIHAAEREEARHATQFAGGACYRHNYTPTRRGGICRNCGDEIGNDEL